MSLIYIYTYIHTYIYIYRDHNNVLLIWAPGHAKIMGNEIADYLAKRGADEITSTDRPPDKGAKFLCSVNFLNSIS